MPKTKTSLTTSQFLRTTRIIQADDSGVLPTEIEVLRTGMWETPWHGDFMITPQDLNEYVQNFNSDVRPNSSSVGLPIDQDHDAGAAAGWMKKLYVQSNEDSGMSLWASVEWTPLGTELLNGKIYSMFSPEFCPRGYFDPEGMEEACDNVLIGGGLTNRPLFKDLKPIVASETGQSTAGKDEFNKIFLSASDKGVQMPTLEEVRVKEAADLNDDERKILEDNKDQLSADEQIKFGFAKAKVEEPAPVEPKVETKVEEPAPEPVTANDKAQVVISASDLEALKASAAKGEAAHESLKRIKASEHVSEKAFSTSEGFKVKADMKEKLVDFYISASDDQKQLMDQILEQAKPVMASDEMGRQGTNESTPVTPDKKETPTAKLITDKAQELVKASSEAGKTITLGQAVSQVRKENPDLAKQYDEELKATV